MANSIGVVMAERIIAGLVSPENKLLGGLQEWPANAEDSEELIGMPTEEIVKKRHLIAKEHEAINMLRAEYAHLVRPDRLQTLADKQLDMQPLALNQIVKAEDLPEPAAKVDSIGRMLGQSSTPAFGAVGSTPAQR